MTRTMTYDKVQHEWRCDLGDGTVVVAPTLIEMQCSLDIVDEYLRSNGKDLQDVARD